MYEPDDGMHQDSYFCCCGISAAPDDTEGNSTDRRRQCAAGRGDGMQPVVMLVLSGIFMFGVIGGISLLSHYYTLNGIKSRTVGDGQHGTARFATKKEIGETYVEVPYEPEKWRKGENLPKVQGLVLAASSGQESSMPLWIPEMCTA